jgi:hypothetical protein
MSARPAGHALPARSLRPVGGLSVLAFNHTAPAYQNTCVTLCGVQPALLTTSRREAREML